jgi:CheY-like chemotaxis protein
MRPCFIILDYDCPGNISARKLVIETAKLNVITAYSSHEVIETLARFPGVNGVVVNAQRNGSRMTCAEIIAKLREVRSDVPIITVTATGNDPCGGEDFHVSSYDPRHLLSVLERVAPESTREIERNEEIGQEKRVEA